VEEECTLAQGTKKKKPNAINVYVKLNKHYLAVYLQKPRDLFKLAHSEFRALEKLTHLMKQCGISEGFDSGHLHNAYSKQNQ